jgi:hypothetical protein
MRQFMKRPHTHRPSSSDGDSKTFERLQDRTEGNNDNFLGSLRHRHIHLSHHTLRFLLSL